MGGFPSVSLQSHPKKGTLKKHTGKLVAKSTAGVVKATPSGGVGTLKELTGYTDLKWQGGTWMHLPNRRIPCTSNSRPGCNKQELGASLQGKGPTFAVENAGETSLPRAEGWGGSGGCLRAVLSCTRRRQVILCCRHEPQ